jgi:multiple sugar transport system ATP-binding protein
VAAPRDLYDDPVNLFVAGFIGSPPLNMAQATLVRSDGALAVDLANGRLTLDDELLAARPGIAAYEGRTVAVGIRPEDMEDAILASGHPADRRLRAKVQLVEALGSEVVVHFRVDAPKIDTEDTRELEKDRRADELGALEEPGTMFVASFGPRSTVRPGDTVELAVDTGRLHFFDLDTGLAIR